MASQRDNINNIIEKFDKIQQEYNEGINKEQLAKLKEELEKIGKDVEKTLMKLETNAKKGKQNGQDHAILGRYKEKLNKLENARKELLGKIDDKIRKEPSEIAIEKEKEKSKENNSNKFANMTLEQLEEEKERLMEEYRFRAYGENGMEEHDDDDLMANLSEIEKEIAARKEKEKSKENNSNKFANMTLEQLEEEKERLMEEYRFRAYGENGMEEHDDDDDLMANLSEIEKEIAARKEKEKNPGVSTVEPNKPEPSKPEPNKPEPSKPEPSKGPDEPEKPEPGIEPVKKEKSKLEFEEILAKIDAAQNALSDADVRRIQNASSPLLPVIVKDKNDWLHNTLRIAANICTFPGRLIGKGISKLLTNKNKKEKLQNIIKNVDELSEEEFETLKNGLASYKGLEGKVSASVRNAVIQREKREVGEKVSKLNQQTAILNETISKNMESIKAIDKKLENKLLSQDRKDELLAQREELLAETTANIASVKLNRDEASKMQGGLGLHGLEEEDRAAREGSNISGRKLGKRYSDDVELQNKEAEIVKKERLARENGDKYAEVEAYLEHEGLLTDNTSTQNILGIEVSRSQRVHSAGVVHKEYENDDLLKNLMTVGFTAAQIQSIMHQISIQKQVNAHNQQIDSINQANQANAATHNQQINEIQTTATTTRGTVANAQNQEGVLENITSSTSNHEAIGISNNFTNNWGKTTADIEHHAREAAGTTLPVNEAVNNLNNAIKGESSHFNRTALSNSLEQFIQNGGSQVISNGYNSVYNFINQVQRLGKIAYDQVGHIKISTDVMPFITATIGKFMSSSKMNNQLENKKKEQKESAKQESEVSKEQESENFELKLDNSEAERDD